MTQHTHDEVIAWIDDHLENLEIALTPPNPDGLSIFHFLRASLLANRAGLERHNSTKTQYGKSMCDCCYAQNGDSSLRQPFPCPTYTDIADPIRKVMEK